MTKRKKLKKTKVVRKPRKQNEVGKAEALALAALKAEVIALKADIVALKWVVETARRNAAILKSEPSQS